MDSRADKLIAMVLKSEGYYANVKGDAGGETYCGIARNAHPNWSGWKIVDAAKPLKYNQKINNAALDKEIKEFYYQNYYLKMKADKLDSLCLAGHVFCMGVNAGLYQGVKLLQKAINKVYGVSIVIDGKIGPQTLRYANGAKQDELAKELINQRNQYYNNIVIRKSSQKKFLNGWLNRVKSTTNECCGKKSKNVLMTTFTSNGFGSTLLKFIFNLIQKYSNNVNHPSLK